MARLLASTTPSPMDLRLLDLRDNRLSRPGGLDPEASGADIVVYSSKQLDVGGNTCADGEGRAVACVSKNASSCGSVTKC